MRKEVLMWKKIVILSLVLMVMLSAGLVGRGKGLMKHRIIMERLDRIADITDDQEAQLTALFYETQREMIRLKAEIKLKRLEIARLMDDPETDEDRIYACVDELADLHKLRIKARMKTRFGMRDILTPEQMRKLEEAKMKRFRRERERKRDRAARTERRFFREDRDGVSVEREEQRSYLPAD
jgi:Spy/CpxP family protein refolding chaperone